MLSVVTNHAQFTQIGKVDGTPPLTKFTDNSKLQNHTTYTYFVTDANKQGAQSDASNPIAVTVVF